MAVNQSGLVPKHHDVVTVTNAEYEFVAKKFRVKKQGITTQGYIELELQETDTSIYTGGTVNVLPAAPAGTAYDNRTQFAVAGLAVATYTETGAGTPPTISDGLEVSWTDPTDTVSWTEIRYKRSTESVWLPAPPVVYDTIKTYLVPLESGTQYDVQARHRSVVGVFGAWSSTVQQTTLTNRDTAPGATLGADYPSNLTNLPDLGPGIVQDPTFAKQAALNTAGGEYWNDASQITYDLIANHTGTPNCPASLNRLYAAEINLDTNATSLFERKEGTILYIPAKIGDTIRLEATLAHDGNLFTNSNSDGIGLYVKEYDKNNIDGSSGLVYVKRDDIAASTWADYSFDYTCVDTDCAKVLVRLLSPSGNSGVGKWWVSYFQYYFNSQGLLLTENNDTRVHRSSVDEVEHTLNKYTDVSQGSGVSRRLPRGMLQASIRDGDVITYDDAFLSTPEVIFIPSGISFNPVDLDVLKDHALNFRPTGNAPTGFTASLKIQELASTITPLTLTPFAAGATYDQEITKAAAAEAWDDDYTIQFDVTISGGGSPAEPAYQRATINIYADDGGGWTLIDAIEYSFLSTGSSNTWPNERKTYNINGMGAGSKFALDYVVVTAGGSVSGDQVEYETATAPLTKTVTKTGAPNITAIILENKDTGLVIS
jgi:hypothetical protein